MHTDGQWKRNGVVKIVTMRKRVGQEMSALELKAMPFHLVFPSFLLPPSFLSSELSWTFENES